MSRSNPQDNAPNPSTKWFEWQGAEGHFKYYDKSKKENVSMKPDFTFIMLDQLGVIKGWNDHTESGIYSNEVRDTRVEPMVVRAFEGGEIAKGIYADIRDRVVAAGGRFCSSVYIAYKEDGALALGNIQFHGAALGAWFEFVRENRKAIYEKGVRAKGSKKDKKGKVEFHVPVFSLCEVSEETNKEAVALDIELQEYLKGYFSRTSVARAEQTAQPKGDKEPDGDDYRQTFPPQDKDDAVAESQPEDDPDRVPF